MEVVVVGEDLIRELQYEKLGHFVCEVLNEDFKLAAFFDYKEENDDILFRFVIEGRNNDFYLKELDEKFETVDKLITWLFKNG